MKNTWMRLGWVIAAIAAAAAGWAWSGELKLYVNGKVASTNVFVNNGAAYVPVKDVAAAFDMMVEKRADGFALAKAGGANQVQGMTGKIGDDLFNGTHKFKVVNVVRGTKYTTQFTGSPNVLEAFTGKEIVAVVCRMKNGLNVAVDISPFGGSKTALTDDAEHAYETMTGLMNDVPGRGIKLLPGAAAEFALIFQVPPGTVLKDLVYEVADYHKPSPLFRISLKQ